MEHTLSIIKPNAVKKSVTGKINALFETNGLKIIAMKMILIDTQVGTEETRKEEYVILEQQQIIIIIIIIHGKMILE